MYVLSYIIILVNLIIFVWALKDLNSNNFFNELSSDPSSTKINSKMKFIFFKFDSNLFNSWNTESEAGQEIYSAENGYNNTYILTAELEVLGISSKNNAFKVTIADTFRWFKNANTSGAETQIIISDQSGNKNPHGYIFMHTILRFYYKSAATTIDIYNNNCNLI